MVHKCKTVQEEIWAGEISERSMRHIENCPDCRQEVAESKRLLQLIQAAADVPVVLDCREAVASKIEPKRPSRTFAYAFAFTACAAAAILLMIFLSRNPVIQKQQAANQTHVKQTPVQKEKEPVIVKNREDKQIPIKHRETNRLAYSDRNKHSGIKHNHHTQQFVKNEAPESVQKQKMPGDDWVAFVSVTWTAEPEKPSDESYDYTIRDDETGETTTCSAERSGNSITINLERQESGD